MALELKIGSRLLPHFQSPHREMFGLILPGRWSSRGTRSFRRCKALQGIESLEQIKSWFQSRFEDRKRLIEANEGESSVSEDGEAKFDLDLAVILAGFAFESYNTPPDHMGKRETDGYKCETTYLSEDLLRELYHGQLTVKLEKANNLPGLDLWGTSDPYVWLRVGDCAKQSRTCWATKDPVWNETLVLNVSDSTSQNLQVAVWDANLLSFHKRLGNYEVPLSSLCDGTPHELEMQLEGMGGGGTLFLKVSYKSFEEIEREKKSWEIPFLSDFIKAGLGPVLTSILGSEGIKVQDFLGSTLGSVNFLPSQAQDHPEGEISSSEKEQEASLIDFVKNLTAGVKSHLGGLAVEIQGQETLHQLGLDLQLKAGEMYAKKGLVEVGDEDAQAGEISRSSTTQVSEIQKLLSNTWGNAEELLGSWLMLAAPLIGQEDQDDERLRENSPELDESQREAMRGMFKRAETAMEAWAILATSLGRPSFVKSEFEKICFLESKNTDTQVSVWRDLRGKRLVVAFRGTEQTKWRDLATDLMLVPTGFNPERIADGDVEDEILVHTGFLSAYDSVRHRLLSIIKTSIASHSGEEESPKRWHIYMTGHSLGGALATLLAMDLSQTQMFKKKEVDLSMYNFGSPRVGNKAFAEQYNQAIKDSWRIVNRRDIIPTVPRLMGYCHVAHPIYLSKGTDVVEDVIGEVTPTAIVGEFLKGEKHLVNKLLHTEITLLRALRDGTALMQHMEDFYYISLLESAAPKCNALEIYARMNSHESNQQLSA